MKIISISACRDLFTYDALSQELLHSFSQADAADRVKRNVTDYEQWFKRAEASLVKILVIDFNETTGQVAVEVNKELRRELKKRTIVNPSAALVREARTLGKKRPQVIDGEVVASYTQPGSVQAIFDEIGAAVAAGTLGTQTW